MTIREYVEQLMNYLTVPIVDILIEENDDFIFVEIEVPEEDAGKMIGKHGDTIAALGHILGIAFREQAGEKRVVVDINGYKQRREDEALDDAMAAADRVVETGRPYHMSNSLHPHQRRVIHQELQEYKGVFTRSEGEGRLRHLVIYPDSMREEMGESSDAENISEMPMADVSLPNSEVVPANDMSADATINDVQNSETVAETVSETVSETVADDEFIPSTTSDDNVVAMSDDSELDKE